jgi:hypothetical protein
MIMKTKKLINYVIQSAVLLIFSSLVTSGAVSADGFLKPPAVFPRDAVVFGKTYADWSAVWYQWVSSMPANANPLFDTADCSAGQSGPVFFLGGRFCSSTDPKCPDKPSERSCTVPAGKALYFPVLNSQCINAEANLGYCGSAGAFITEMRAYLADGIDQTINLGVTVDGKKLKGNLKTDYRVQSNVFSAVLPDKNFLEAVGETGIGAGTYWGVDDGIYVMLQPLPKGTHTINFEGTFPQYKFTLDFTYYLTVQ